MTPTYTKPTVLLPLVLSAVLLFLMFDLMGTTAFLLSCFLYLVAFFFGRAMNRLFSCVHRWDNSPIEIIGKIAFETTLGMGAITISLYLTRTVGLTDWLVLGVALLIPFFSYQIKKNIFSLLVSRMMKIKSGLKSLSFLLGIFIAVIFVISDSMITAGPEFYFRDSLHPMYELSISKSTVYQGFLKPDLSYTGKLMRYHMLGPIWTSVLDRTLQINGLATVYRVVPMWQLFISTALMVMISYRISKNEMVAFLVPVFYLLVTPFIFVPLHAWYGLASQYILYQRVAFHSSSSLAAPALMAFMIFCTNTPRENRRALPGPIGMLFSAFIFFSKATYILPVISFLGLSALRDLKNKKRRGKIGLLFVFLCMAGTVPFVFVLIGAHKQNFWAIVPYYYEFSWIIEKFQAQNNIPLQVFAWIFALPLGLIFNHGFFSFGIIFGVYLSFAKKNYYKNNIQGWDLSRVVFGSAAMALFASSVVSEFSEGNSYSVVDGYLWAGWVGLALLIPGIRKTRGVLPTMATALFVVALLNIFIDSKHGLEINGNFSKNSFIARTKIKVLNSLEDYFYTFFDQTSKKPPKKSIMTKDLYDVLQEMKGLPPGATILRGRHYEYLGWRARETSIEWWPDTSFIASAISGKQFVVENHKWKGIAIETDYLQRSGDVFKFYWWCGQWNHRSHESGGWILPKGELKPWRVGSATELGLVKMLLIKGNPSWFTARRGFEKFLGDISEDFTRNSPSLNERINFCRMILDKYHVTHILFERNEAPDPEIVESLFLTKSLAAGSVSLYRYK